MPPACWAPPASAPSSRPVPTTAARRAGRCRRRGAAGRGGGLAAAGQRPACRHGSRRRRRRRRRRSSPGRRRRRGRRRSKRPLRLVRQSRKPLIVAGLGAHRAGAKAALEQLADRIGALLVTSARGKDMFRGHPCNLGIVGSFSHSAARRMIDQADCVLVFGAGLNLLTMSFGHSLPKVPLIQVDADARPISAAGIPPTSPWWAMRGWRPRRCSRRCRPAPTPTGRSAPRRRCASCASFDIAARLPAGQHGAHGRSARARRGAREAPAGQPQPGLRRRQLPRHRALPVRARIRAASS